MTPILVIGYGNPLRSDDGIGWLAARGLFGEFPGRLVRVESAHQLLPEMADWIGDAAFVIFLDACWDVVPGRIRTRTIYPDQARSKSMTHHCTPQGVLSDAQHLFHHCPDAVLISVGGASFDYGESLSPALQEAFPRVMAAVRKLVRAHMAETNARQEVSHA